jgi:ribosome-associated protein
MNATLRTPPPPPEAEHGQAPDSAYDKPSKSARKRDMHRLQDLAETLALLNANQLAKAPISESLLASVQEFQAIRAHEGKRRQAQYLGKVMREEDADAIQAYVLELEKKGQIKKGTLDINKKYK